MNERFAINSFEFLFKNIFQLNKNKFFKSD